MHAPHGHCQAVAAIEIEQGHHNDIDLSGLRIGLIIARDGDDIEIWPKSGKPLGRYFPEMVADVRGLPEKHLLLGGEPMVPIGEGRQK